MSDWEMIPSTPEQKRARSFLEELWQRRLNIPGRKVPGLGPTEKRAQEMLSDWMGRGTPPGVKTAIGEMTKTVEGDYYDPYVSKLYRPYRDVSRMEEAEAVNAMRRRAGNVGMARSTPALDREGRTRRGFAADREGYLAGLYDRERGRQVRTAPVLAATSTAADEQTLKKAQAGATVGAMPRQVETEQERAIWEALVQTLLAPYNYQQGPANTILNEQRFLYAPDEGNGLMNFLGSAGANFLGTEAGAGAVTDIFGGIFGGGGGKKDGGKNDWAEWAKLAGMFLI
jgi:hypothetical protein